MIVWPVKYKPLPARCVIPLTCFKAELNMGVTGEHSYNCISTCIAGKSKGGLRDEPAGGPSRHTKQMNNVALKVHVTIKIWMHFQ